MIFNCGNFERIAFRHRGSQNLYLSDLIHIPNCKDPGYAKLHIGLYMSIMHDVLERTRHIYEHTNTAQGKKRRRGEEVSAMSSKRPKTRAVVAKLLADKVEHESLCDVRIYCPQCSHGLTNKLSISLMMQHVATCYS